MKKLTLLIAMLIAIGGCSEPEPIEEIFLWDGALECSNEESRRNKNVNFHEEIYLFIDSQRKRINDFRAQFYTNESTLRG